MDQLNFSHSLRDWQLTSGHTLSISTTHYVSSPSSLKSGAAGKPPKNNIYYLKESVLPALNSGRVSWYHWPYASTRMTTRLHFRSQDFPTVLSGKNCYSFQFSVNNAILLERVNGSTVRSSTSASYPHPAWQTWTRYRVAWWSYLDELFRPRLALVGERFEAGHWVQRHQVNLTNPLWENAPIARVGFGVVGAVSDQTEWVDDTEVWKAIE